MKDFIAALLALAGMLVLFGAAGNAETPGVVFPLVTFVFQTFAGLMLILTAAALARWEK